MSEHKIRNFPVTDEQIDRVAKELEASGKHPSVDAVFSEIGKNRVRIAQRLKERREERREIDALTTAGLSPVVVEAVKALQVALESEALAQVEEIQQATNQTIESLEGEKSHLQAEKNALSEKLDTQADQIGELLGANDSLSRQLREANESLIKVSEQIQAQENLVQELRSDKSKAETQLENTLNIQSKLNDRLLAQQQSFEAERIELREIHFAELAGLSKEHESDLEQVKAKFDQVLEETIEALENKVASLKTLLETESSAHADSKQSLETLLKEANEQQSKSSRLEDALEEAKTHNKKLAEAASSLKNQLREAQTELAVVSSKLEDKENQLSEQAKNLQLLLREATPKTKK